MSFSPNIPSSASNNSYGLSHYCTNTNSATILDKDINNITQGTSKDTFKNPIKNNINFYSKNSMTKEFDNTNQFISSIYDNATNDNSYPHHSRTKELNHTDQRFIQDNPFFTPLTDTLTYSVNSPTTPTDLPSSKGNNPNFSYLTTNDGEHPRTTTHQSKTTNYQCTTYPKSFLNLSNFTRHQRTHSGEKSYQCQVCNKYFSDSSNFNAHKRIHTGDKRFQCKICNKNFTQKNHLSSHKRLHTGERPYQCQVCNKRFSDPGNFNTHKRTHSGEKPYQCQVCNKRFSASRNLKKHKLIHTGEKLFKCLQTGCNKKFAQPSGLTRHFKKTHG